MIRSIQSTIFAVSLLLASSGVAIAGKTTYENLLDGPSRPTMKVIARTHAKFPTVKGIPIKNQFGGAGHSTRKWMKLAVENAPKLIAALESTFPGGTWVFLGRDSLVWSDAIEAFYLSRGETGRVERIGASKASFASAALQKNPDGYLMDLLKTHGFDLDAAAAGKARPFIMIDTVSSGGGRQARSLLGAAYRTFVNGGGNPADLLTRLNFMGLEVSTFQGRGISHVKFDQFRAQLPDQEARYRDGQVRDFEQNHLLITYPQMPNTASEAGYEHYTFAWHGSYGEFSRNRARQVTAAPGEISPLDQRQSILWMQRELWLAINSQKFHDEVDAEAKKLGIQIAGEFTDCARLLSGRR